MTSPPHPGLAWLNHAPVGAVRAALHRVCASAAWGERLLAARPFADQEALLAAADAALAELPEPEFEAAVAGHPPIGRPRPGDPTSAREQSGLADADQELRAELLDLNLSYQERFGRVFLICASGLSGERMRDALRARLAHEPAHEAAVARGELGKINRLRLVRLVTTEVTVSTHVLDTSAGRPAAGVPVRLAVRDGRPGESAEWTPLAEGRTDADGRCGTLPPLPGGSVAARLTFVVEPYLTGGGPGVAFFPEATVDFAVTAGERYHIPLLLNPFGYSVYRGS
ncbi:2-oxo-4-hydroxy-4-carboxy-5-ureidoimidazoline decarboxylase [Streptomyces sp. DSM 44915]|uniref:2-oxo-4-hydroxy-4-carboxy-5-ureidoimidazoline decarboxylase n=1 Tax=Streptomyces chisholmiae TaxID=3075540 RepID=A0ABU2JMX9_9ACTN|nr:2-oxo-4-hydroxy-4-carboxy-5-ureidoimidazoline decarboxylase [Streptomyces sp. DSM 44915]MDT0266343.1 2-oxo-4-hydroxy-4-carboxy-5-ureidoimidazoline decarboxylase [Streptomyces sp. DSM 44915]